MTAATTSRSLDPRPFAAAAYVEPVGRADELAALRGEIRNELRTLRNAIGRIGQSADAALEIAALRELVEQVLPQPSTRGGHARALRKMGVEGPSAARILRQLRDIPSDTAPSDALEHAIAKSFRVTAWPTVGTTPVLVALIGPSGVGKTTTCAKLAAHAVRDGRSVTLVACDGFRVAGTRQLERYAELMGVPFVTATNAEELARVTSSARADVVIVDTAGTRERPEERSIAQRIGKAAPAGRSRHVLLAVPAAIRARDASFVASSFATSAATALCITKLDETNCPAGILHMTAATGLPIAVLCNGPRVPEDITQATHGRIVSAIVQKRMP
jgi:flagellar biosynthesis protein FlhF